MKVFNWFKVFLFVFSLILSLVFYTSAYAGLTGKITGKVSDDVTGKGLFGAIVLIEGTSIRDKAGPDGSYYIINIPPGTYTVIALMIGYTSIKVEKVKVIVDQTTEVSFKLKTQAVTLQKSITVTAERPHIPGRDTTHKPEPPKQEIRQVFENRGGWDLPLDSCGGYGFLYQIKFDPLPEVNRPTKIYVKLKSCGNWDIIPEEAQQPPYIQDPRFIVHAGEEIMDFTELEPKWYRPIKKGDIYEGSITIVPREIGRHGICIAGQGIGQICFYYGFDEDGKLVHLSDRGGFPKSDLPFHPLITDKEIYVKFNGQYVTNLFHITPPLSLNDTSTVYYRVITKDYYPDGMKIVTRDHHNISFKMLPGPITKGDTLEGSFKAIPPRVGWNSIGLGVEEPPREGVKPKNDSFSAQYHLLKDGKLLYIVKSQKEYNAFFEYYKKRGMDLEKF